MSDIELPAMVRLHLRVLVLSLRSVEKQIATLPTEVVARTEPALDPVRVLAAGGYAQAVAQWRERMEALYAATVETPGSAVSDRPRTVDHREKEEKPA